MQDEIYMRVEIYMRELIYITWFGLNIHNSQEQFIYRYLIEYGIDLFLKNATPKRANYICETVFDDVKAGIQNWIHQISHIRKIQITAKIIIIRNKFAVLRWCSQEISWFNLTIHLRFILEKKSWKSLRNNFF